MTLERRSRGKIACYASREPTEFDAISNQRRDRGARNALWGQDV
jgi:hypothetical protein